MIFSIIVFLCVSRSIDISVFEMYQHLKVDLFTLPRKFSSEGLKELLGRRKHKTLDLLEMKSTERIQLIKKVREELKQKSAEIKLWQWLLDVENLTINGNLIYGGYEQLTGFTFDEET
jgi:hypothetical protein